MGVPWRKSTRKVVLRRDVAASELKVREAMVSGAKRRKRMRKPLSGAYVLSAGQVAASKTLQRRSAFAMEYAANLKEPAGVPK